MDRVLEGRKLCRVGMGQGGIGEHNDVDKDHLVNLNLNLELLFQVAFRKAHRKNEGLDMDRKVVPVSFHRNKHTGCPLRM